MPSNIAKTTLSRVFMTLSAGSPAVQPVYQNCLYLGSVTQNYGDRTPIYCQDPYTLGKFQQVGVTESPAESVSSSLSGRFLADARSNLIQAAKAAAPIDVHVHVGAVGSNPTIFTGWKMKIIFEGARISSLDIDELGSHEEDTPIGHSVEFAADRWYQLVPLVYTERATTAVTNALQGAFIYYNGMLELPPRERVMMLAVSSADGGSVGTQADLLYSLDSGTTWYADNIDSALAAAEMDDVAVIGEYAVVCSSASPATTGGLHYVTVTDLDGVTAPSWTQVLTGLVAGKGPKAISSIGSVGFIAGLAGYVYKTTYVPGGVTVMSAGAATTENLNAIHAYDETTIVAVGAANTVIYCLDGSNFDSVTGPAPATALTAVAVLSPTTWLVGNDAGSLYYTTNSGKSWTEKSFPSSGSGNIEDIKFVGRLVGYMSHTLSGAGRLLQTTDGGYSWSLVPSTGLASYADALYAIGVLRDEPNLVMAVGLADDGSDGVVIVGEPAS